MPTLELLELHELDEIVEGYPDGWNIDLKQVDRGRVFCKVRSVAFEDLTVIWNTESLGSIADYTVPAGTTLFAFQNVGVETLRWCGIDVPECSMLINPSGRDYALASRYRFDGFALSLPNTYLAEQQMLADVLLSAQGISERWVVPLGASGLAFRSWLAGRFADVPELQMIASDPLAASLFRDTVCNSLGDILATSLGSPPVQVHSLSRRFMLAQEARDYIAENDGSGLTIDQIAGSLGITSRELRYAFREAYGISPYQYVVSNKLNDARRILREADIAGAGVTQAALEAGFEDFSRFARFYARTFGELPSETLKRSRRVGAE